MHYCTGTGAHTWLPHSHGGATSRVRDSTIGRESRWTLVHTCAVLLSSRPGLLHDRLQFLFVAVCLRHLLIPNGSSHSCSCEVVTHSGRVAHVLL